MVAEEGLESTLLATCDLYKIPSLLSPVSLNPTLGIPHIAHVRMG